MKMRAINDSQILPMILFCSTLVGSSMAFAPPTVVQSITARQSQRPQSESTSLTEPLFLMEMAIGNTSFQPQPTMQPATSSPQQSPSRLSPVTTQQLSLFSNPLAAGSAAIHASLLSLLDTNQQEHAVGWIQKASDASSPIAVRALTHTLTAIASHLQASQFLSDVSHVALDGLALVSGPSMMGLRLASVAGRLCSLTADYLPDHTVTPDDWFFQLLMLHLAFAGLYKTAAHAVVSQCWAPRPLQHQDMRAFVQCFKPAGMTWNQYQALAAFAMEWITVPQGETLSTDSHLHQDNKSAGNHAAYLLVKGKMTLGSSHDEADLESTTSHKKDPRSLSVLGDVDFLQQLDSRSSHSGSWDPKTLFEQLCSSSNDDEECRLWEDDSSETSTTTWTAVDGDAQVLRIQIPAALSLIHNYDEHLEKPLRTMMIRSIQGKLGGRSSIHH